MSTLVTESTERRANLRIGILGGTFDPVHVGHVTLAARAADALHLDRVLFVVAGTPPFKQDRVLAPASDRYRMVQLACANDDRLEACDIELHRLGVSYSIDTLRELRERADAAGADAQFFFLLGSDAADQLDLWKDADQLTQLATFVVVPRAETPPCCSSSKLNEPSEMTLPLDIPAVSSCDIRARLAERRDVTDLLPAAVATYITEHGLYHA
ncbi:MAG: nicotinate-nucleotide adenylyltransferase [Actinomycetes bacterium]|nr:nicotinate-nucleotide adenylyltransferase [Actinomycetes bacterium]